PFRRSKGAGPNHVWWKKISQQSRTSGHGRPVGTGVGHIRRYSDGISQASFHEGIHHANDSSTARRQRLCSSSCGRPHEHLRWCRKTCKRRRKGGAQHHRSLMRWFGGATSGWNGRQRGDRRARTRQPGAKNLKTKESHRKRLVTGLTNRDAPPASPNEAIEPVEAKPPPRRQAGRPRTRARESRSRKQ